MILNLKFLFVFSWAPSSGGDVVAELCHKLQLDDNVENVVENGGQTSSGMQALILLSSTPILTPE